MTRRGFHVQLFVGLLAVLAAFGVGFLRGRTHPHKAGVPGSAPWTAPKFTLKTAETKDLSAEWTPIVEKYAGGVCVLTGRVMFLDGKGNPFRYNVKTWTERGELVADPTGQIYYRAFSGTGFHIGDGVVLSHHELLAHRNESTLEIDQESTIWVSSPDRFHQRVPVDVTATFPGREKAFHLRPEGYRLVHGVPEFTFDLAGADIPVLPIQEETPGKSISAGGNIRKGDTVLMLGSADPLYDKSPEDRKALSAITAEVRERDQYRGTIFFRNSQQMNPGFPIFSHEGVVIGIFGSIPSLKSSEFFQDFVSTDQINLIGNDYAPHRAKKKLGIACECDRVYETGE